jgi:hypothetical protein
MMGLQPITGQACLLASLRISSSNASSSRLGRFLRMAATRDESKK